LKRHGDLFGKVVEFGNLHRAFRLAARGKSSQPEVIRFRYDLERNLIELRSRLLDGDYEFGPYRSFQVLDPKPRRIVAAPFPDRVAHHAMCSVLAPVFEPTFIRDSYACLPGRGTHAAVLRLQHFTRRPGGVFVLQCDVRKYFQTIDRAILGRLVRRKVKDRRMLALTDRVIDSAPVDPDFGPGKGLPIGNLTSQLLANVYLDPLDHFVKEVLRRRCYVRYVDDFAVLGETRGELLEVRDAVAGFLVDRLALGLHPHKSHVFPCRRGITFLGYRIWPHRRRVKTATMVRMRRREKDARRAYWEGRIDLETYWQTAASLLGYTRWGDGSGALKKQLLS